MAQWWNYLDTFEKIFWYIAIPFTVLFAIQLILTFVGLGGGEGDTDGGDATDGAESGASFRIFTIKNFIIFFTVFGWSGITLFNSGANEMVTLFVSILIGVAMMFVVGLLFLSITRLTQSGTMIINHAKGRTGEVYLPIPPQRSGTGKISITLQGSLREIEAMTEGETLPRGTVVKVVAILGNHIVVVEKT